MAKPSHVAGPPPIPERFQECIDTGFLTITFEGAGVLWNRKWHWDMDVLKTLPAEQRSRVGALWDEQQWHLPGEVAVERWFERWEGRAKEAIVAAGLPDCYGRWRRGLSGDGWEKEPPFPESLIDEDDTRPFRSIEELAGELEGGAASSASIAVRVLDEIARVRFHCPPRDPVDRGEMFVYVSMLLGLASHTVPRLELALDGLADVASRGARAAAAARRGGLRTSSERSGWNEFAFRLIAARSAEDPTVPTKELIGWATDQVNERQRMLGRKEIGDSAVRQAILRKRALYDQCLVDAKADKATLDAEMQRQR